MTNEISNEVLGMKLVADLLAWASAFLLGVLGGMTWVSNMAESLRLDALLFTPSQLVLAASMLCLILALIIRSKTRRAT
ncbi:hypothetical protein [Aurantiacibacter zhengii]|nr:hypothetical protein [Aurantiacibacter zhengii]